MKKVVILALDGFNSVQEIGKKVNDVISSPIGEFISHFKFNDALHLADRDWLLSDLSERYPGINFFFDLKLPDTNGTDKNILKHYLKYMRQGDIVTVSSIGSARAFREIRGLLPAGVKIAIVSVLTDTPEPECRSRRGMVPKISILNDATNLLISEVSFDAIICSPAELKFLKANLPDSIEFFVPGVRDSWMDVGQQSADRINGIAEILDDGANNVVLGAQLMKGNPQAGIDAAKSCCLTTDRVMSARTMALVPGDLLQTLINLQGFYQGPTGPNGELLGPLVAYAGTYPTGEGEKNWVGNTYFNLSVIEKHPLILGFFAKFMADEIQSFEETFQKKVDCLVGVPTGGVKIAQETGRLLNIPGICLEREVTAVKTKTSKEKFDLCFRRNADVILPGNGVVIFEDLCNNFTTTAQAVEVVKKAGGVVLAIACVINRSINYFEEWNSIPIIPGHLIPSGQYQQSDPVVRQLIAAGKLSTDPKKDWSKLRAAMKF